jgi:hypothetical protein
MAGGDARARAAMAALNAEIEIRSFIGDSSVHGVVCVVVVVVVWPVVVPLLGPPVPPAEPVVVKDGGDVRVVVVAPGVVLVWPAEVEVCVVGEVLVWPLDVEVCVVGEVLAWERLFLEVLLCEPVFWPARDPAW